MKKRISLPRRFAGVLMILLCAWMCASPTALAVRVLPGTLHMSLGQSQDLNLGMAVLSSQDETLVSLNQNTVSADALGETQMTINLFGLFPIGKVKISVTDEVVLVPGGQAVGVAMATRGVLVVGVSDVAGKSPAQSAGIRAGDIIESINGETIQNSDHLIALVAASGGAPLNLVYQRDGAEKSALLTPQADGGTYKLGVWVRDSTAGVGTLSFYNPADNTYGALGHAINDSDTGKLLSVRQGNILRAQIVDVRRGVRGTPGELRGSFLRDQTLMGDICANTIYGIYGHAEEALENALYPNGLPIGLRDCVHTGPATILSTIDGNGVREYAIEITQVNRQNAPAQKSMVIRVTDPVLLEKTGGIVQGMSGSPIIQDGRIIGAVTHVFVDDPTQGYGLYVEWMLAQTEQLAQEDAA